MMRSVRHHLVVLSVQYLRRILIGRKTMECRLSKRPGPPYRQVAPGDVLWLKQSGGPIRGLAIAGRVHYLDGLDATRVAQIRTRWNNRICGTESFWHRYMDCRFATLIQLEAVQSCEPFYVHKTDRRAWVVLRKPPAPGLGVGS